MLMKNKNMRLFACIIIAIFCLTLTSCSDTSAPIADNCMEYLSVEKVADLVAMPYDDVLVAYDAVINKDVSRCGSTKFGGEPVELIFLNKPFVYDDVPVEVRFEIARGGVDCLLGVYYDFGDNHKKAFDFAKDIFAHFEEQYQNVEDPKQWTTRRFKDLSYETFISNENTQYSEAWLNEHINTVFLPEEYEGQSRVDLRMVIDRMIGEHINKTEVRVDAGMHHFKGLPKVTE